MWISKRRWENLERRVDILELRNESSRYEVQQGDTLFSIAKKMYGTVAGYEVIALANQLTENALMRPGQILLVPPVTKLKLVRFHE